MKALTPSIFWALANHLQHCGHPIYLQDHGYNIVHLRLSSGDRLHNENTNDLTNIVNFDTARALCERHGITNYVEVDMSLHTQ